MAAPKGNKNAAKGREWADAIRWALGKYESSAVDRGQALRKIAERCIEQALEGDKDARREIGDRLDGKPAQAVELSGETTTNYRGIDAPPQADSYEEWVKRHVGTAAGSASRSH